MIFKRIEDKCRNKGISVTQMLGDLKIGTNTYYAARRVEDLKVSTLRKIAEYLETPIGWFVGDIPGADKLLNEPGADYGTLQAIIMKIDKTTTENNKLLKHITGK